MKTTTFSLTSLLLTFVWSFVVCPQGHAQLLTSPNEDEPPPIVEQQSEPEKKPADEKSKKDSDAKAKKSSKKKQKDEKSDAASSVDKAEDASGKKSDAKKADKESKKADKKKTDKSDDKTADAKDDKNKSDKSAKKKSDDAKSGESEDKAATTGDAVSRPKSTVPLPKRLASFTCGAVLGYPVAFAKRTVHQTKAGNKDFIGESTNPVKVGLATIVSLPFGFVGGMFEGLEYTVVNSWNGSGQDPFGKESFSLGDD